MNILFIGGAGFIGSSLVKRFISDEKHSVFWNQSLLIYQDLKIII